MSKFFTLLFLVFSVALIAQEPTNIRVTNTHAAEILKGTYSPEDFSATRLSLNDAICEMNQKVNTDSLESMIRKLVAFHTRHTYSDTLSDERGVGAARRWVKNRFERIASENDNRLISSFLQFDYGTDASCGAGRFKNIFAVLPGSDTGQHSGLVVIEAHMDSRCEDECDIDCFAPGADDNASGTAMVLELAELFSRFEFDQTLVFLLTVGEEQGLYGARAFAQYCFDEGIAIRAVQNNDIVGGIICGETSSPPSCDFAGDRDSTNLRIFSFGNNNSPHKAYARFAKMINQEFVKPISSVPMNLALMGPEDRSGRGGDHIPFRQLGYTAVRFTSANEHGNGNPADSTYHDHQHTVDDIIGLDTDGDQLIDSFFVDFRYLARNTVINGAVAAATALGAQAPEYSLVNTNSETKLIFEPYSMIDHFRIAVRSDQFDFDALYRLGGGTEFDIPGLLPNATYRVSACAVNQDGVPSLFGIETAFTSNRNTSLLNFDTVQYVQPICEIVGLHEPDASSTRPNSVSIALSPLGRTAISLFINSRIEQKLNMQIFDSTGKTVYQTNNQLIPGDQTIQIDGFSLSAGIYFLKTSNSLGLNESIHFVMY